jgi:hypothetical protein
MIHFAKEGQYKKLGLSFYRTTGGFVVGWAWYDVRNRELYGWRFRFRHHIRPWFIFERNRQSIIDGYLSENDAVIVQRALLEDHAPFVDNLIRFHEAGGLGVTGVRSPRVK